MEIDNENEQTNTINLDHITKLKIFDTIHDFGKKDARNNDATQEIIVDILKDKLEINDKKKYTISDILKEITKDIDNMNNLKVFNLNKFQELYLKGNSINL